LSSKKENIVSVRKNTGFEASNRLVRSAIAVAALVVLGAGPGVAFAQAEKAYAPGRILVMPRAGMPEAALAKILNENGGGKARRIGKTELRIVDLPPGLEKQSVEKLARHPHIEFAELDQVLSPEASVNDPYFGSAWHLAKIGTPTAWDTASGSGVTIAILDSGVDASHPDLAARMVPGWNWYDNNSNTSDVNGHGTLVAGAAAASMNNGTGVAGVAGTARLMPVRISDANAYATFSTIAKGLTWAADNGARVANISYKVAGSSSVISAANYMKGKGGLVLSSAGNAGVDEGFAPTTSMIAVAATDSNDAKASWSSFGSFVSLSAPGVSVWTTVRGGGYGAANGTSFSSPVTAGVVALMMSVNPTLPASDVEKLLFSTALDLGTAGRDSYFGYGRVNASAAVSAAAKATSTADTTAPTVSINAPLGSSTVSGLVAVDVSAADNKAVSRVDLLVNGKVAGTDTASPFAFSWDSSQVVNGMNNLSAVAYDAAGNQATSAAVAVNVSNSVTVATIDTVAPTVKISNPVNGAKVGGTVSIKVAASDNAGIAGLSQKLYINERLVAQTTGGSLSYSWNTRKEAGTSFTVKAVVVDKSNNVSTQAVQVSR
jgi:thermitase